MYDLLHMPNRRPRARRLVQALAAVAFALLLALGGSAARAQNSWTAATSGRSPENPTSRSRNLIDLHRSTDLRGYLQQADRYGCPRQLVPICRVLTQTNATTRSSW
jgi:hypothetical protein